MRPSLVVPNRTNGPSNRRTFVAYYTTEITGSVLCMLLFVTLQHAPGIVRHPTVKSLVAVACLTGWVQALLVFTPNRNSGRPSTALCLVQGAMTVGKQ